MAASTLVTIFCNGCGTWEATGHTAADARRSAKRMGWAVALPSTDEMPSDPTAASLWRPGSRRDLCPDCARAEGL